MITFELDDYVSDRLKDLKEELEIRQGPEGPQGPKGDMGPKGDKGEDGKDADLSQIKLVKDVELDSKKHLVVYYTNGETKVISLEELGQVFRGTVLGGGGGGLNQQQVINLINAYHPPTADNIYVQEECPNSDNPHLWIRTCSNGRINFLVKR